MIFCRHTGFLLLSLLSCLLAYGADIKKQKLEDAYFINTDQLVPLFEKLYDLQVNDDRKINIVHIGDSHVQADLLTNVIRQGLQTRFGNAGYGFSFPYSLAKTNGSGQIKYSSEDKWDNQRNIYPVTDVSVGLSGIGLYTTDPSFCVKVETNSLYQFDKITVITSSKTPSLDISFDNNTPLSEKEKIGEGKQSQINVKKDKKSHVVRKGETLYGLATKNKTTVEQIKKDNNLTSNVLKIGMTLFITDTSTSNNKESVKKVEKNKNTELFDKKDSDNKNVINGEYYVKAQDSVVTNTAYIKAAKMKERYNICGIILENDKPGIIYHSIGVNGAKISDYNKYPLFFKQLPIVNPDLIIISLGTNESFGNWSTPYFLDQLNQLVKNIKKMNPSAIVLVTTPPPSLFKKRNSNLFIEEYRKVATKSKDFVVWDLLNKVGGIEAPKSKEFSDIMARDKVHYTREGYEMQAQMFVSDFLNAYDSYIKNRVY